MSNKCFMSLQAMPPATVAIVWLSVFCGAIICPANAWAEDPVAVLITGPLAGKIGDRVAFEVEIVNRSGRPLEKLRIVDYFDKGYHHEVSISPIEQKGTIDLAAGTSRRLTLDFTLDEPGRQCHRVEIIDTAHVFVGGATACVEVAAAPALLPPTPVSSPALPAPPFSGTPLETKVLPIAGDPVAAVSVPALELSLVGPAETLAGTVAEYSATVRNTGTVSSGATSLEFAWEDAFIPLEASDGYKLGSARVSWSVPPIEPGGQLRRQINLRSQISTSTSFRTAPATRSCVRSVLSGLAGGVMVADESCVLIKPSAPPQSRTPQEVGLRLSLADCDDPVSSDHATTIVCTISNQSNATNSLSGGGAGTPSGRLDLVVVLPDQARLIGDPSPSRVRIDGSTVMFDSIPSIAPGSQATFELSYRLPAGGVGKVQAIVSGTELDGSLEANCTTSFLSH